MKAILSIILASMILFFSAGLKVATHHCGDVAVRSALTTDLIVEGCGMGSVETNICNSEFPTATKKNCCNDELVNLEIQDDYEPSKKTSTIDLDFLNAFVQVFIANQINTYENIEFISYSPPLVVQDLLIEHQSFLI